MSGGDLLDPDTDGYYLDKRDRGEGRGPIIWGVVIALLLLVIHGLASAQEPPPGPDQPTPVMVTGSEGTHHYQAPVVDTIVRGQHAEYLRRVLREWEPVWPTMTVGLITGLNTASPLCPPERIWRLSGYVVTTAARVELRVDGGVAQPDVPLLASVPPGGPKSWYWCVPPSFYDGLRHRVYARALRSTGTVIGPLDNAKSAAQWEFSLARPAPPAPTVIVEGNELAGYHAPAGAVDVLLVVNGSTGLPGNPAPVVNGEWRWRMAYVVPGTTASLWARARDATGAVVLWEHKGTFNVP